MRLVCILRIYFTVYRLMFRSDIHPWDILVDGSRWQGKIRLIGFVDVFFLICYSGESRFEKGIIIYSNPSSVPNRLKTNKL